MGKSTKIKVPPKKRGGPRKGAGRKPGEELKKAVTIYVKESSIERHGGELFLKEILSKVAEGELWPIPASESMTRAQKNQEKKQMLKAVNPPLTDQFKKTFPPSDADIKAAGIPKDTKPAPDTSKILDQIAAIRAEKIPAERNTAIGKKVWEMDQKKRIEELQSKL